MKNETVEATKNINTFSGRDKMIGERHLVNSNNLAGLVVVPEVTDSASKRP